MFEFTLFGSQFKYEDGYIFEKKANYFDAILALPRFIDPAEYNCYQLMQICKALLEVKFMK